MATCQLCNSLAKKNEDDVRLAFDFTPDQLVHTATRTGCVSCVVILDGILRSESQDWTFTKDARRVYARCCGSGYQNEATLSIDIYFVDDRPKLELEFFTHHTMAWRSIMPRKSISGHPLTDQALAWVLSQLENCGANHNACQDSNITQLPKRLLAIKRTTDGSIQVNVVENPKGPVSYVTLSHCWGKKQSCTSTRKLIGQRKVHIPWNDIPKTFQDAIIFTLALNISYIWIDSLCIIQDDGADWDHESSKMADIYQNSYLTLAATAAADDFQGCFKNESPFCPDTSEVHLLGEQIEQHQLAIRNRLRHWHAMSSDMFKKEYPLLSRAWVFQERLLSPRILHFCNAELIWECRQALICECGHLDADSSPGGNFQEMSTTAGSDLPRSQDEPPSHFINPITEVLQKRTAAAETYENNITRLLLLAEGNLHSLTQGQNLELAGLHDLLRRQNAAIERLEIFSTQYNTIISTLQQEKAVSSSISRQYRKLIEEYSALSLTRRTDRLPALSGLCERISHLRDGFMAGIWTDSIWLDLLWRVEKLADQPKNYRSASYARPSWSWISVESPIKYWHEIRNFSLGLPPFYGNHDTDVNVVALDVRSNTRNPVEFSYKIQLAGENPYGAISSAVLTIQAWSRAAYLRYVHDNPIDSKDTTLKYNLEVENTDVPLFADYVLARDGPYHIADHAIVRLLLIHPQVALVLVQADFPKETPKRWKSTMKNYSKKLYKPSHKASEEVLWERIGIARVSDTLLDLYKIDWMIGSSVSTFNIV